MERPEFDQQLDKLKAVDTILGEPVFVQFDEQTTKIRNNLIIASAVSIALCLADLHISPDSRILGLKFAGLTDDLIRYALLGIVGYLLLHFMWSAGDSFIEWRLRITGTKAALVQANMWVPEHVDLPKDPRQSTLYNWWKYHAGQIGNIGGSATEVGVRLKEWDNELQARLSNNPRWGELTNSIQKIRDVYDKLDSIHRSLDAVQKTFQDVRIPMALERFDRWFEIFLRSQNLRWLLIDAAAPLLFSLWALYLLAGR